MDAFGWILVAAVPVLYALFWWLDWRWQAQEHAPVGRRRADDDED